MRSQAPSLKTFLKNESARCKLSIKCSRRRFQVGKKGTRKAAALQALQDCGAQSSRAGCATRASYATGDTSVCPQGCGGHGCPHGCPTRVRLGWPQAGSHVQCLERTSLQLGSCGHRGFSENAPSVWPQVLGVPFFPAPSNPGSVAFCSAHAVQSMVRMKGNVPGLSCARLKG